MMNRCTVKCCGIFIYQLFYRNFAKKTIMKTARKAGIAKQKAPKRKYVLPTPPMSRRSMSPRSSAGSDSESDRPVSEALDDLSST